MSPSPDPRAVLQAALIEYDTAQDRPAFTAAQVLYGRTLVEAVRVFLASTEPGVDHGAEQAPEAPPPSATACRDEDTSPPPSGPNGERAPETASGDAARSEEAPQPQGLNARLFGVLQALYEIAEEVNEQTYINAGFDCGVLKSACRLIEDSIDPDVVPLAEWMGSLLEKRMLRVRLRKEGEGR